MKRLTTLMLGLALLASPSFAADASKEPIKIGDINAGGSLADFVQTYKNAAQMAVDEINASGGINGRPLQIIRRDSKFDPGVGVKFAEELITREKVDVLMDCDSSAVTLAVSEVALHNKIPFINACSEGDDIMWEQGNDYIFRVAQGGYMWISALLDEAERIYGDKLKGKRWAVVAPNFIFGQASVKTLKVLADERGLKPEWVSEQWPAMGKMEAGPTMAAIQHARPDIIVNLLFDKDLVKSVREGIKRGVYKNRIVFATMIAMPDHIDMFGKEMPPGWLSIGFPLNDLQEPSFLKFKKDYAARYAEPLKFYSLSGYNAVQAFAAAFKKAGSTDPQKVRDALEVVSLPTPLGEMRFRKIDHIANVPFWVGTTGMKNGKGALLNWKEWRAFDHSPTDAQILERRAQGKEGK